MARPVFSTSARSIHTEALVGKDLKPPLTEFKIFNPRNRGSNIVVPGKGYPKTMDAARQQEYGKLPSKKPQLVFDATITEASPSDPTGAVGPNHYVNAWNSAFSIYDKEGNLLLPPSSLSSLGGVFEGEDLGDPIVLYDSFADRFLITQMSESPISFLVAVSRSSDPVNDGWYTYRFETGEALPDYPKISVWSDGYYITTNKESRTASSSEVVYVLERDKMLLGQEARSIGFPLPGITNNGFYSPAGFSAVGEELPPEGNMPVLYFQDDAWKGVNEDHLKIWLINVDWENIQNSTISESQELTGADGVTPFISTFDGGSFTNLEQPGDNFEVDALQGAVMYMTPYRRFQTHNSAVLNFVVDIDPSSAEHAGIRWYELRQESNGGPWRVFQEGTYAPDASDRFCGSIGIDEFGNIGMGFTVLNDNPEKPVFPSLRYTGHYSGDPLGIMTLREQSIVEGPSPDPTSRYGDYAHLTIDPVDDRTFWYIGEYFVDGDRVNKVGVFALEPELMNDVGVVDIVVPQDATFREPQTVTITIRNFGFGSQTSIPVEFSVDGGATFTDVFSGTLPRTSQENFTFSAKVDISEIGEEYEFVVRTNLPGDANPENDEYSEIVENLRPVDVGVTAIDSPITEVALTDAEVVTVSIQNFGGDPQTNIPVSYSVDGGALITEIYTGTLEVGEEVSFSFSTPVNISNSGTYEFFATTSLEGDVDTSNDDKTQFIANLDCIPEGSICYFGDGISSFYLGDIVNEHIPCGDGYADYIGFSTELDRSRGTFIVTIEGGYSIGDREQFSMWIDFNDNAAFEDSEIVLQSAVIPSEDTKESYYFSIPETAPLGEHLLRVRAGDTGWGGELNNPCSVMEYGTTHDYSVVVVDEGLEIEDLDLSDAELLIGSRHNNIFEIEMRTFYEEPLRITVHDMLGQKLVENIVEKSVQGYMYTLDMSYAATGVYLVRFGTRKFGKVERIIVQ
ncbi:MAG TPA: GEVED domain-containing protein [Salinimicrobium sp.]|nr:GEVED domain-containing protein [Salinimicrobium sp.]